MRSTMVRWNGQLGLEEGWDDDGVGLAEKLRLCTRRWCGGMKNLGLVEGMGYWRSWRAGGGPISPEGESQARAEAEALQTAPSRREARR